MSVPSKLESNLSELGKKLTEGVPPSNVEVEQTLDTTKRVIETQPTVGQYGARLTSDLKETIEDVKQFIKEKNPDEQIQKIITHGQELTQETQAKTPVLQGEAKKVVSDVKGELQAKDISGEATELANSLISVSRALVESPDFRNLLLDFIQLMQDSVNQTVEQNKTADVEGTIRDETKSTTEVVSELSTRTKQFVEGLSSDVEEGRVVVPEERKRELRRRYHALIHKLTRNQDLIRACNCLLNLFDDLRPAAETLSEDVQNIKEKTPLPDSLMKARDEAKSLLSKFCGEEPLNLFNSRLHRVFNYIYNDRESTALFYDARAHIRKVLENPPLLEDDFYNRQTEDLYYRAKALVNRWRTETDLNELFILSRYILLKITNDPLTNKLIEDFKALTKDMALDSRGRPNIQVTSEAIQQIRQMMIPIIIENLREVPIPRISGSTPKYDYMIENLSFYGYDIIPENVKVKMESDMDINMADLSNRKLPTTILTFKFKNIKVHLRDIKFEFYRKVIPRIHDKGIADVDIVGDTTRIKVKWMITWTENGPFFSLLKSKCYIRGLKINVKEAQHSWLYNFLVKTFSGSVKDNMEKAVENRIRSILITTANNLNTLVREPGALGLQGTGQTLLTKLAQKILPEKETMEGPTTTVTLPTGTV